MSHPKDGDVLKLLLTCKHVCPPTEARTCPRHRSKSSTSWAHSSRVCRRKDAPGCEMQCVREWASLRKRRRVKTYASAAISSKRPLVPRRLTIIPAAPIASAPIRVIGVGIASIGTVVGPIAEPAVTGPGIDDSATPAPAGFCRIGGKRDKGERKGTHCYDQSRKLAH